ncbi:MAG: hypothetical protein Q3982_08990 [Phoenicibacter congonensis]|uniref:Uncharacterized protein n=1 Tax=Phoenicibacter congonensis TaxID=1944646 RepID=A0AA43RLK5_9ACTN|nr:hypothetical protein [Phoenicibacter congonensis]
MSKNGKKVLAALMCALICGSSQALANGINNIKTKDINIGMISARLGPNVPNQTTSNQNIARTQEPVPGAVNQSIDIKLKLANANPQSEVITVFRRVRLGMKM